MIILVAYALFFVPELIESGVRVRDSYSFLYLANYVMNPSTYNNLNYSQIGYLLNWPGFAWFAATFYEVTGMSYHTGAKALLIVGQILLLVISLGLGHALFRSRKGALTTGFIVLSLVWDVWGAIVPELLGEIFLLTSIILLIHSLDKKTYIPFALIFGASTLSHGLTAVDIIIVTGLLVVVSRLNHALNFSTTGKLASIFKTRMGSMKRIISVNGYFLFIAILIFGLWFVIAPSAINEDNLIMSLRFIFSAGVTPLIYQLGYLTPARYASVASAAVYLVLVGVWFGLSLLTSLRFGRTVNLIPILLLTMVSGMTYLFLPTSQDFYDRFFQFGLPFLAWFFAASSMGYRKQTRLVPVVFVVLLLSTSLIAGYSHEATLIYPPSENRGDYYLLIYTVPTSVIAYLTDGPTAQGLSDLPQVPVIFELNQINLSYLNSSLNQAQIIVDSIVVQNGMDYFFGSNTYIQRYLHNSSLNLVYQSGLYSIYTKVAHERMPSLGN